MSVYVCVYIYNQYKIVKNEIKFYNKLKYFILT